MEQRKAEIIELLELRIKYYRDCVRNAGDSADIIHLGQQIGKIEVAISVLQQESWNDEDWLDYWNNADDVI